MPTPFNTFAGVAPPWSLPQLDANFADTAHLNGDSTKLFSVSPGTAGNHATDFNQAFGLGQSQGTLTVGSVDFSITNSSAKANFTQSYITVTGSNIVMTITNNGTAVLSSFTLTPAEYDYAFVTMPGQSLSFSHTGTGTVSFGVYILG
jgi:hypothetical protein